MDKPSELLENLDKLHTTPMGVERICRTLEFSEEVKDVVAWCREKIASPETEITRNGKNWYASHSDCTITVNAHSFTIITAHKNKK